MTPREQAIGEFEEKAFFDRKAQYVLGEILKTSPTAMLMVWENHEGIVRATAVPSSHALARGLVEAIYNAAYGDEPEAEEEEED